MLFVIYGAKTRFVQFETNYQHDQHDPHYAGDNLFFKTQIVENKDLAPFAPNHIQIRPNEILMTYSAINL
jgi:hypothetical protein